MKYWDQVLAVVAVLMGLCCLLLAWTGFSGSPLTGSGIARYGSAWAPVLGLLCVAGALAILLAPLGKAIGRRRAREGGRPRGGQ